jgi:hypothetical protein
MDPHPQETSNFILLIEENRDIQRVLLQVFNNGFPAFFGIDAQNHQTLGFILIVQPAQRRSLLPAVRSPGSPEVQQNDPPPVFLNPDHLSGEILQGKIWNWFGFPVGLNCTRPPRTLGPSHLRTSKPPEDCPGQSQPYDDHPVLCPFHRNHPFIRQDIYIFYSTGMTELQGFLSRPLRSPSGEKHPFPL